MMQLAPVSTECHCLNWI